ncbi:MAG TPA: hypothetical protein VFJ57_04005 [Solirubrobacterales bacterium]|nr:hypothetical protein [Solirubrobacterales bacterium]
MRIRMAGALIGLLSLVFTSGALAAPHNPTGEWANFADCPLNNPTVENCVYSVTTGGSVTLGSKTVPIENPATLQGGFAGFGSEIQFYGAEDGNTLSKTPQPVPGGLAGLIKCKEISNFLLRLTCEAAFENGLTGVNATLELAAPATSIKLSTENLIFEEGVALQLPVKVHLENPFLGSKCYVGSDKSPLIVDLTTGGSGGLHGAAGEISFNELFDKTTVKGSKLVNNTFAAPGVTGCGGAVAELLINPLINAMIGLPAGSGTNSAILEADFENGAAESVRASE